MHETLRIDCGSPRSIVASPTSHSRYAGPAVEDREQRAAARQRHDQTTASKLGLGHDIRAA